MLRHRDRVYALAVILHHFGLNLGKHFQGGFDLESSQNLLQLTRSDRLRSWKLGCLTDQSYDPASDSNPVMCHLDSSGLVGFLDLNPSCFVWVRRPLVVADSLTSYHRSVRKTH